MVAKGLVIKSAGSTYTVRGEGSVDIECKLVGRYRLEGSRSTNPVVVGDWVSYTLEEGETIGRISDVESRKNYIIRKSTKLSKSHQIIAANLDQVLLMVTITHPVTHPEFIDRYLVSAEAYSVPAIILVNKSDLHTEADLETLEEWKSIYAGAGYDCFECSVNNNVNLDRVIDLLRGKVSLLAGNSGVGKSTLVNAIEPGLNLKTADISDYHKSGKHTTTFAEMHELKIGGYIIDTPGIRGFGITDMEDEPLFHYFPEIFRISAGCKFHNCLHTNEPGCAVYEALKSGELHLSRYKSYINLLEEQSNASKYR